MTLRPALAGAAIVALLLTGCASTPGTETSSNTAASSTPDATPTPTVTPEAPATPTPTTAPAVDPTEEPLPAVTAIVLGTTSIDFLAADGITVDSAPFSGSAEQTATIISEVLGAAPAVELPENEHHCSVWGRVSTWPGGIQILEGREKAGWMPETGSNDYHVFLTGSGHNGVTFQTASGYKVGDPVTESSGVTGTMHTADTSQLGYTYAWFATELANPEADEHEWWGVVAEARDGVIESIMTPSPVEGEC